jgi:hypothetical protein
MHTVHRYAQYSLLLGAVSVFFAPRLLLGTLLYTVSCPEMLLIVLCIGIPGATVLTPILHRTEGTQATARQLGIVCPVAIFAIALALDLPITIVASLASLCSMPFVFAASKFFAYVWRRFTSV